jgi:hypothetical protein
MADRMAVLKVGQRGGLRVDQKEGHSEALMAAQKEAQKEGLWGRGMGWLIQMSLLRGMPLQGALQKESLAAHLFRCSQASLEDHLIHQTQHQACSQLVHFFLLHEFVLQMFFFPPRITPHSGHTARLK